MTLSPGVRLGVYEVLAPLGKGGMGEVWRARDTRLGREVALKTLPADVAADPGRLARFEREAKLLASLNHPNLGGIHGLEESGLAAADGRTRPIALVLELIEGETLADHIARGPIPIADAIGIAIQICAALEAAHDRGIIHRDLKPANIKITPEGVVKVLDFGLAKAVEGRPDVSPVADSPTLSLAATRAGIILGTAAYMAPEQASGGASDTRADIWALGVVLFEMLTGRPVFAGETVSHVLAAVLATSPPWAALPADLPPRLRELLERCLAKKPSDRYRHVGDVRADLERVLADPPVKPSPPVAPVAVGMRAALPWMAGAALLSLVVAAVTAWWLWPPPVPAPVMRFSIVLPDGQTFSRPEVPLLTVSADGTRVAYVANDQIYVRHLGEFEARPVPGTEDRSALGPGSPVFSPDGEWIAYVSFLSPQRGQLKRVPVTGGTPVTLLDGYPPLGLSWPEPDTLLFAASEGIVRLPAAGGAPEVLVAREADEAFDMPQLLPDGRRILFTRSGRPPGLGSFQETAIVVQSIGETDRRVVRESAGAGRYVPTGHLVYAQGGTLFAVPFDAATATPQGSAVPMVEGARRGTLNYSATANYALSDAGMLVLVPGTAEAGTEAAIRNEVVWVDRNGREEVLPVRPEAYTMARISPDGNTIALVVGSGLTRASRAPAIWLFDLRTGNLSLLTAHPSGDDGIAWSPDSRRIFFRSFRDQVVGVYAIDIETGVTELVSSSPDVPFPLPWSVSPDGQTLAIVNATTLNDTNIAMLSVAAGGSFARLLHDPAISENEPVFSPDGMWMAYHEGVTPASPAEINIRPFPGVARTRIPLGPGREPVFSRDGSELFFYDGGGLAAAPVLYAPAFRVGRPQRLFPVTSRYEGAGRAWDADPSGRRFLLIRPVRSAVEGAEPEQARIDIVVNWVEELKARVRAR